jgi:CheY-like chemotaxis protein
VVEDNPVNRRLCGLQLRRIECEAEFAITGLEAVEAARAQRFDAVLMDMQLPGLDGCEATREIRRIEKERGEARMPIIAMTANARTEDRQRCLDAGMDDYLSKPLRQETLAAMLAKWILR